MVEAPKGGVNITTIGYWFLARLKEFLSQKPHSRRWRAVFSWDWAPSKTWPHVRRNLFLLGVFSHTPKPHILFCSIFVHPFFSCVIWKMGHFCHLCLWHFYPSPSPERRSILECSPCVFVRRQIAGQCQWIRCLCHRQHWHDIFLHHGPLHWDGKWCSRVPHHDKSSPQKRHNSSGSRQLGCYSNATAPRPTQHARTALAQGQTRSAERSTRTTSGGRPANLLLRRRGISPAHDSDCRRYRLRGALESSIGTTTNPFATLEPKSKRFLSPNDSPTYFVPHWRLNLTVEQHLWQILSNSNSVISQVRSRPLFCIDARTCLSKKVRTSGRYLSFHHTMCVFHKCRSWSLFSKQFSWTF